MKHFNGFCFMMNRNVCKYERDDGGIFDPENLMIKNEDTFNWRVLLPNNDIKYPNINTTILNKTLPTFLSLTSCLSVLFP